MMNPRLRKIFLSVLITLSMIAGLPGNTTAVFGNETLSDEDIIIEEITADPGDEIGAEEEPEVSDLPVASEYKAESCNAEGGNVISGDVSSQLIQEGGFPDSSNDSGNDRLTFFEEQPDYEGAFAALERAISEWNGASNVTVDLSDCRIPASEVKQLLADVINSHPEFFYVDGAYTLTTDNGGNAQSLSVSIKGGMSDKYTAAFNDKVAEIIAGVDIDWTDLQKAMYIHDYLVTHVQYDLTYSKYTAEDAIIGGSAVCEGYSLAYMHLMNKLGSQFKCDYVGSYSLNHAWNYLTINSKQYYVDCTWDDPTTYADGGDSTHYYEYNCLHRFFMLSRDGMRSKEHNSTDWKNKSGKNIYSSVKGSTDYEAAPWMNTHSPIPMIGNIGAYYTDGFASNNYTISLYAYDFITAASNKLADYTAKWYVWGKSSWWTANYTSLSSAGLYFTATTPTEILLINSSTGEKKSAYKLTDSEKSKGYIYGAITEGGKLNYQLYTAYNSGKTGSGTVDVSAYENEMARVVLDRTSVSLDVDETLKLTATVLPESIANKNVNFKSMDPAIATVDNTGKITGISGGRTVIIASPEAGGKSAHCKVKVGGNTSSGLDTVISASDGDTLYLIKGQKYSLNRDYSWESSDPATVEITDKNTIKGKKAAESIIITGKPASGSGNAITCKVCVAEASLEKKATILVGGSKKLTLNIGGYEDCFDVTWNSSNPSVASVVDGNVTALGKGSAKVTAWVGGKQLNSTIKVVEKTNIKSIKGDSLTLQPLQSVSLKFADKFSVKNAQWNSSLSLNEIKNKSGKTVAYQNSVVRIETNGKLRAIGPGDVSITAVTAKGVKTLKVTVPSPSPRTYYVMAGKTRSFSILGIKPKNIEWHSEAESVAAVKNGKICAGNTPGEAKITGHYDPYNSGKGFDYTLNVYTEKPSFSLSGTGELKASNTAGTVYDLNIKVDKTCVLTVEGVSEPVLFRSKNNQVAFAEFNGNTGDVYARMAGKNGRPCKTKLTAKIAGKTYTINVSVSE